MGVSLPRGLLGDFPLAISGNKNFKHATDAEFDRSYQRARKHGIAALVGARLITKKPLPEHERATGQGVMSL